MRRQILTVANTFVTSWMINNVQHERVRVKEEVIEGALMCIMALVYINIEMSI